MSSPLPIEMLVLRPMRIEDVPEVIDIEARSYDFPWSEKILFDCIKAGYLCNVAYFGDILGAYGIIESMKNINPLGDVTHDGNIDVTDVLMCVNIILGQIDFSDSYVNWASDLDSSGWVNVIDILNLVNIILSN